MDKNTETGLWLMLSLLDAPQELHVGDDVLSYHLPANDRILVPGEEKIAWFAINRRYVERSGGDIKGGDRSYYRLSDKGRLFLMLEERKRHMDSVKRIDRSIAKLKKRR